MTAVESAGARRAVCHREKALGRVASARPLAPLTERGGDPARNNRSKTMTKPIKMIYLRPGARHRPARAAGMILCHNHILHDAMMPIGCNGFRAFCGFRKDLSDFVPCPCGWRPDLGKHYALKEHVKRYDTPRKRAKRFREFADSLPIW
jgi:hypothetical protein